MKPIRTLLLALSALTLSVGSAGAFGHDHGGGGGGRGGYRGGGGFAGAPRAEGRGGGYPGGYASPSYPGGRDYAPQEFSPRGYAPSPYEQPSYARPAFARPSVGRSAAYPSEVGSPAFGAGAKAFRRGQYLPRAYWSGEIANPRSRHLRTPPPGYGWVGVGPNAYLMQRSTGLVLDSVPGAW